MNKQISIVAGGIVLAAIMYALGFSMGKNIGLTERLTVVGDVPPIVTQQVAKTTGESEPRQVGTGIPPNQPGQSTQINALITSFSALVRERSVDSITVTPNFGIGVAGLYPSELILNVNSSTQFTKLVRKSKAQIEQDQKAYDAQLAELQRTESTAPPPPQPYPFTTQNITLEQVPVADPSSSDQPIYVSIELTEPLTSGRAQYTLKSLQLAE